MKKSLITLIAIAFSVALANAQNYEVLYMQNIHNDDVFEWCVGSNDGAIIYGNPTCGSTNQWDYGEGTIYSDHIILISNNQPQQTQCYEIVHVCGYATTFYVCFLQTDINNPFSEPIIWKRKGECVNLHAGDYGWYYNWSNNSTENEIEVSEPGIYTVNISDGICLDKTFSVEVRDNVEIESASVDPESNKNLITWEVTPGQAEYISNVIINRDGVDLATVPYINGQYLDNIGSDLAARIYTVTGVSVEGTPCQIPSLERGTIHMAFLPDINGNIEMTWNCPELGGANIHVGRYEICEYDPNGKGGITVIDFVGPSTMSYSCSQSMFDYGYPLIRAIIQDGRGEKDMLSNRTEDLVGLDEIEGKTRRFEMYPNPTDGPVTIKSNEQNSENEFTVTITNLMGQTIVTGKTESGVFTFNEKLAPGFYFVNFGGNDVQKLVVR